MAQALPDATRARLNRALESWRQWSASMTAQPAYSHVLPSDSNDNVVVDGANGRFVVRLDRDTRHLGVDRSIERTVLEDIGGASYAPPVVYVGEDFLVTRYVEGHHGPFDPETITRLFHEIHSTPTRITTILDPTDHARGYLSQLSGPTERVLRLSRAVFARPAPIIEKVCLCHVDPAPENFIATADSVIALDWEYARLCNPAYDLAVFVERASLDDSDTRALIHEYRFDGDNVFRMRIVYRLIESLWWLLQDEDATASWDRLETLLS